MRKAREAMGKCCGSWENRFIQLMRKCCLTNSDAEDGPHWGWTVDGKWAPHANCTMFPMQLLRQSGSTTILSEHISDLELWWFPHSGPPIGTADRHHGPVGLVLLSAAHSTSRGLGPLCIIYSDIWNKGQK